MSRGLYIKGFVEQHGVNCLVDTGSVETILSGEVYDRLQQHKRFLLRNENTDISHAKKMSWPGRPGPALTGPGRPGPGPARASKKRLSGLAQPGLGWPGPAHAGQIYFSWCFHWPGQAQSSPGQLRPVYTKLLTIADQSRPARATMSNFSRILT